MSRPVLLALGAFLFACGGSSVPVEDPKMTTIVVSKTWSYPASGDDGLEVATSFSKVPADELTETEIDTMVASAKFDFNVTPNIPGDYEMVAIGHRETCKKIISAYLRGLLNEDPFQTKLWEASAQQHSVVMEQFREEYPQFMQATMILGAPSPYALDSMRYCYQ